MQVKNPQLEQQIIEAARRCFFEMGYKKTSIGDIAREGYTTNSNIYTYFEGKLDIFNQVIGDVPFLIDTYIGKYYREAVKQFSLENNTMGIDEIFPDQLIFNKRVSMTLHILFEGSDGTPYACYKKGLYSMLQDCARGILGRAAGSATVNLLSYSFVEKILAIEPKVVIGRRDLVSVEESQRYNFRVIEDKRMVVLDIFEWGFNLELLIEEFWTTYDKVMSTIPVEEYEYIVDCKKMPIVFDEDVLREIVTRYYETHFRKVKYVFTHEQIALSIAFKRLTQEVGHHTAEFVFEN